MRQAKNILEGFGIATKVSLVMDQNTTWLKQPLEIGEDFEWIVGMYKRLHGIYSVKRLVGEGTQVVEITIVDSNLALESVLLDVFPRVSEMMRRDIDGLHSQTMSGHGHGDVSRAGTCIEHLRSWLQAEPLIQFLLHGALCRGDGKG